MEQIQKVAKHTYVKKQKHEFFRALDVSVAELASYLGFSRQYTTRAIDKIANDVDSLNALKNALISINTEKTNRILKNLKAHCEQKSINVSFEANDENLSPMERIKKFINGEIIAVAFKNNIDELKQYIDIMDYLNKYQK